MAGSNAMDLLLDFALAPALWLGLVLALSYSLFFYTWRGGGMRQLGRDLLAGIGGFAAGQILGMLMQTDWLRLAARCSSSRALPAPLSRCGAGACSCAWPAERDDRQVLTGSERNR